MDQLLFVVITFGIALPGIALLAWLQHKEHELRAQHPHSEEHPTRSE